MRKFKVFSTLSILIALSIALFYLFSDEVRSVEYSINRTNETIFITDSKDRAIAYKSALEKTSKSKDDSIYSQTEAESESLINEKDLSKIKYLVHANKDSLKAELFRLDSVKKVFILRNRDSGYELSFSKQPSDTKYSIVDRKYIVTSRKSKFSNRIRYHLEIVDYAETDGIELTNDDTFN